MSKGSKIVFQDVVQRYVDPIAFGAGFQRPMKKHAVYYRWNSDCLHTLACGFRPEKGRDEGWVEVSACVGFRSLAEFLSQYPEMGIGQSADPNEPCAMGGLTGRLRGGPPYQAVQWRTFPDSDPDEIGPEVVQEITNHAFPFYERYGTLDKALAAWETGVVYTSGFSNDCNISGAYWIKGNHERAVQYFGNRLEYWRGRYEKDHLRTDWFTVERYESFLNFLMSLKTREDKSQR
jgi:hypothetical protein